jgi:Restriction endonuclease
MSALILERLARLAIEFDRGAALEEYFITPHINTADGRTISIDHFLEGIVRAVILGNAGAGKTTLLRYLARVFGQRFLAENGAASPVVLQARNLHPGEDLLQAVTKKVRDHVAHEVRTEEIAAHCSKGELAVFVDGVDELLPNAALPIVDGLRQFADTYPRTPIVISTRPVGAYAFPGFQILHLANLDLEQITAFARNVAQGDDDGARKFVTALSSDSRLEALTGNPLLLTLLWQLFRFKGRLSASRAFLYADIVDVLLSNWNKELHPGLSVSEMHALLEAVALFLHESGRHTITGEEFKMLGQRLLGGERYMYFKAFVTQRTGIFTEVGFNTYSFVHLSFQEYFVARGIATDPKRVVSLVFRRDAHEIIALTCGLMEDITPVVTAALDQRDLVLAAKCISQGRTANPTLVAHVIKEFASEIGDKFVTTLVEFAAKTSAKTSGDNIHHELLRDLDASLSRKLSSQQRGKRFEEFAIRFFSQTFKVVRHDLNTEDGEIDLVLESILPTPFWSDYGGEFLVECKNWADRRPLKEALAFVQKANMKRVKLAFFVSVSGFTKDAIQTIRNNSSNQIAPLVIPIDGSDIRNMLLRQEIFEEFMKEQIRKTKYLEKYAKHEMRGSHAGDVL